MQNRLGSPVTGPRSTTEPQAPSAAYFARFLWLAWPWVNWILPALLIFGYSFSNSAGWDGLFLLFLSPVLVPAFGLLGSLPRFIMRRRGYEAAPAPVGVMLAVH